MSTRDLCTSLLVAVVAAVAVPAGATPVCTAPARLIQYPTGAPVWEFCLFTPSQSSGNDGSGIEIRDAFYNGHKVFKRAHNPVLNVNYVTGCGCYRDWIDSEWKFQVVTALSNPNVLNCPTSECTGGSGNYVEAIVPPVTVCTSGSHFDVPPSSGFKGVAGERLSDRLILTTQLEAGWYRYYIAWTFHMDGRMEPRFGFGAVTNSCVTNHSHRHHAYWRFDFDIDTPGSDHIGAPPPPVHNVMGLENMRNLPYSGPRSWEFKVHDTVTLRGYSIVPGPENLESPVGSPPAWGGPFWQGVQYPFDVTDSFMFQYKESAPGVPAEINDNAGLSQCALTTTFLDFDNNEALNDNGDVVVWYRGGAFHQAGDLDACAIVGPTLYPIGNWNP